MKLRTFRSDLMKSLKNADEAAMFLEVSLEEADKKFFMVALRSVVDARGGVYKLAKHTKLNRANLYRMLSEHGNPEIITLNKVLHALGLTLSIKPFNTTKVKRRSAHTP